MSTAVMVGGPWHGRTQTLQDPLPNCYQVPRITHLTASMFDNPPHAQPTPEHHLYELRWYESHRPWTHRLLQPAYLCTDPPTPIQFTTEPTEDELYYARVAESLWHTTTEAALPTCVVPDCTDKGRLTFTAAENGRLAGQAWQRGDEIRLCPRHGHDVYRAQGAKGMAQLAEWMRADATWDPLDAYDGGTDLLYGAEILERTARMLRLLQPSQP